MKRNELNEGVPLGQVSFPKLESRRISNLAAVSASYHIVW